MGFQRHVNRDPAPAVEGDFAGTNPRASVLQPIAGAWKVAPGQQVRVGYFAFGGADGLVYSDSTAAGPGAVVGFVGRGANAPSILITEFLGESRMTLNDGMPVTLFSEGDFWANFPAGAAQNVAIYATAATGAPTTTAGGNVATRFKTASASRAPAVSDATTTIDADTGVLTVNAMAAGSPNIEVGDRVTGTGVPEDTYITGFITGTGGVGTYQTNSINRPAVPAFTATFVQGALAKITSNQ